MKIFRSESLVDYKTYTFNYATYCEKENLEELAKISGINAKLAQQIYDTLHTS